MPGENPDSWAIPSPPRGRKKFGQHFLRDAGTLDKIVRTIAPSADDCIVEVGAGQGVLTEPLARAARSVVAVEIDEKLGKGLEAMTKRYQSLSVACGDVLSMDVDEILRKAGIDGPYVMTGNLPYYIAAAVIRHFLEAQQPPRRIVAMMQKEVAENMASPPGDMTLLGACVQFYAEPRVLFRVSPQVFSPPPRVWSAVIELNVRSEPLLPREEHEKFFELLRAGFRAPRKQLHNSLALGLGIGGNESTGLLKSAGIDPVRRAQTVSLVEWLDLFRVWQMSAIVT